MKSPAEPESTMAVTETWKFIDFKVTGIVNGAVTERDVRTELTSIRGVSEGMNVENDHPLHNIGIILILNVEPAQLETFYVCQLASSLLSSLRGLQMNSYEVRQLFVVPLDNTLEIFGAHGGFVV